nr:hypothetical protein [Tanacetum cinerariifolium]
MIDQEKIMMAVSDNIMRKTPQEAYDLIKNTTLHHFQWDTKVYYDTTTGVGTHYFETIFPLSAQIEDEPLEEEKSDIDPLIRESTDNILMRGEEIELNSHEDIDDLVPIPRNEESDEFEIETIIERLQIHSLQSIAQNPSP